MLKVNNKKTINKLSQSSFQVNKLRNFFAVAAIILTTVLFTGLFTIVCSLLDSMEESTMRQVGGNMHGSFKYLTQEQYDTLRTHKSIKDISYSVVLGIAENEELAKRPAEIRYASSAGNASGLFSLPATGRLPQNKDEAATDTIILKHLGIPAELGQKITLEYTLSGQKYTDTFTLVGFWEGDKLMPASQIWLDKSYVEQQLENYVPSDENNLIGSLNADVNFANSVRIEDKLLKVIEDSGYTADEIDYGVNWAYLGNSGSFDFTTALGAVLVISMIIFCGYLIISNVFYISVSKDIHYYGLLKTIGTTGKQISFIIRRQALLLCLFGIPLGLICGFLAGAILTPAVLSIMNTNVIKISFSPVIFIASACFAIVTVVISVSKPSRIAARVNPIEALRSTDITQGSKKSVRKNIGVNIFRMASVNVSRNWKKAVLVTVSLSLSLIILNSAYSLANSFDMDEYLSFQIGNDFCIGDVSCFNVHIDYTDQDTLNSEFYEQLLSKQGIEAISSIYFSEPSIETGTKFKDLPEKVEKAINLSDSWLANLTQYAERTNLTAHIYGLDDDVFERLTVHEGEIDLEKLKTGNYVIAAPYDSEVLINYYEIGDTVSLPAGEGTKDYEVIAIASLPYNISIQHSHPITPEFFLPSGIFLENISDKAPMLITVDAQDSHEAELESFLAGYSANVDENLQYKSKASIAAEYENMQRTYKAIGIVLSSLVAFIGIMNFINTVITSILSRKKELAMLQSIGMTNRQTESMMIAEGLIYTILTAVFVLTAGCVLGYFSISAITGGGFYLKTYFTVLPSLLCLPFLAFISILVPLISQRVIGRDSIVERLRETE